MQQEVVERADAQHDQQDQQQHAPGAWSADLGKIFLGLMPLCRQVADADLAEASPTSQVRGAFGEPVDQTGQPAQHQGEPGPVTQRGLFQVEQHHRHPAKPERIEGHDGGSTQLADRGLAAGERLQPRHPPSSHRPQRNPFPGVTLEAAELLQRQLAHKLQRQPGGEPTVAIRLGLGHRQNQLPALANPVSQCCGLGGAELLKHAGGVGGCSGDSGGQDDNTCGGVSCHRGGKVGDRLPLGDDKPGGLLAPRVPFVRRRQTGGEPGQREPEVVFLPELPMEACALGVAGDQPRAPRDRPGPGDNPGFERCLQATEGELHLELGTTRRGDCLRGAGEGGRGPVDVERFHLERPLLAGRPGGQHAEGGGATNHRPAGDTDVDLLDCAGGIGLGGLGDGGETGPEPTQQGERAESRPAGWGPRAA